MQPETKRLTNISVLGSFTCTTNPSAPDHVTKVPSEGQQLKTVDTFKSSHLVYLNIIMHKITNLLTFELNRSAKLRDINERKNTLVKQSCVLSDA